MRNLVATAVACVLSVAVLSNAQSAEVAIRSYRIEPQPMSTALKAFAAQSELQLIYTENDVGNATTSGVSGDLVPAAALDEILKGTSLKYEITTSNVVVVRKADALRRTSYQGGGERIRVAAAAEPAAAPVSTGQGGASLEEVVVTAQKREERLQDVPIPVSVLAADSLSQNGQVELRDYFTRVPGTSLASGLGGTQAIVIRGVSTGTNTQNPTAGVVIDDAPYGASTFFGGATQVIDIDPTDLARIEVLRGPQGTLYGASSMGGLLKYVTADPSVGSVSGRLMVSTQTIRNDDGQSYGVRGSINIPVSDTLALRASGFTREDAGYIDDPVHDIRGINGGSSYGGRLAALWQPSEDFSVKLSAIHQNLQTDGSNNVDADASSRVNALENSDNSPGALSSDREVTFVSAAVSATVGKADLAAISAYTRSSADLRQLLVHLADFAAPFGGDAAPYMLDQETEKFSQELRITLPLGQKVEWLLGAFYTDEKGEFNEYVTAGDEATGALLGAPGNIFKTFYGATYEEIAAFTNLTVHFTDAFDIQFGARESQNRQTLINTIGGALAGGDRVNPPVDAKDNAFTYQVSPRLKLSDDVMLYSRIAQGYRPGGPNFNVGVTSARSTYSPDTTSNYEIGIKAGVLNGLLSVDASVYRIDWDDIALAVTDDRLTYIDNVGAARIEGVELSLEARPADGLKLAAWGAWSDARMDSVSRSGATSTFPGDRLPYSARFSGNVSADYQVALSDRLTMQMGTSLNYVGERLNDFSTTGRARLPAYSQWDLHGGLDSGDWEFNLFVNNVADERGVIGIGVLEKTARIIRPRTIGLSIAKDF